MLFLSLLINVLLLFAPKPEAQVERLYWDHIEGFYVADTAGQEIYCGSRNRLYHTMDFGKSWNELGRLPEFTLIKQIIPIDPKTLVVIASFGFHGTAYLSRDAGRTFEPRLACTGDGECAAFDKTSSKLYVAAADPFCLMVSTDHGYSWSACGQPFDTIKKCYVCSLLLDMNGGTPIFYVSTSRPGAVYCKSESQSVWHKCFSDPRGTNRELPLITRWGKKLIACAASGPNPSMEKIYLSENNGVSWKGVICPFNIWGIGVTASDTTTMWIGNYASDLNSPENISLQYSRDEGKSWNPITECSATLYWQFQTMPNGTLYAATDSGLIRVRLSGS